MNTEIAEFPDIAGWVCYDADCAFCTRLAARFRGLLASRKLQLIPLQTAWVRERLGWTESELLSQLSLLKPDGRTIGGADAIIEISGQFWWAWPLRQAGRAPVVMRLFRFVYRWIARHRHCVNGACRTTEQLACNADRARRLTIAEFVNYLPLLLLPILAGLLYLRLSAWVFMWAMAFAIYAGCKWLTCCLVAARSKPGLLLQLGYLIAWPGMNAAEFFDLHHPPVRPARVEWLRAFAKIAGGALLLWGVTRTVLSLHPLLAGWIGMTGFAFIVHFGLFHCLSLAWKCRGINAAPVMRNPLGAGSVTEFWGARWNTAFNELAFRLTFIPLRRRVPLPTALLAVFGLSGLIHELVISVPAHGGYGLPTLYFLIQGLAVAAERCWHRLTPVKPLRFRAWVLTALITAGPAPLLFHPPFIHHVILPMLAAIGAT